MNKVNFIGTAFIVVFAASVAAAFWQLTTLNPAVAAPLQASKGESQPGSGQTTSYGGITYADPKSDVRVAIYLPESVGNWDVENPWRDADTSLIKEPKVFARMVFQSQSIRAFYGVVREAPDLGQYDCGVVFSRINQLDGSTPVKYVETDLSGSQKGKVYVVQYLNQSKGLVISSKDLCADGVGVELMIVSPNEDSYSQLVAAMLQSAEMVVPTK